MAVGRLVGARRRPRPGRAASARTSAASRPRWSFAGPSCWPTGAGSTACPGPPVVTPDYTPVANRIRDEATDDWNDQVAVDRFTGKGGTFVRGAGRLVGRRRRTGGCWSRSTATRIAAPRVVISTGTAPAIPPIAGLAELRGDDPGPDGLVWTNREVLRIRVGAAVAAGPRRRRDRHRAGAGLARFGTKVTVLEGGPRILAPEEPEAAEVVTEVLRREGVDVRTGARTTAVAAGRRRRRADPRDRRDAHRGAAARRRRPPARTSTSGSPRSG